LAFLKAINYTNICFYLIYSYFLKIVIGVMVIYLNSDWGYGYFIKIVDLFCIKKVLKKIRMLS